MSLDDKIKELDEIDALRSVYHGAYVAALDAGKDRREADRDGFRAILSALASKGVDSLPNVDDVRVWFAERGGTYSTETREGASMMRSAAAPIFAAKDAERAALHARVAELETSLGAAKEGLVVGIVPQAIGPDVLRLRDERAHRGRAAEPWPFDGETPHETVARLLRRVAELEKAILETPQGCACKPSSGCERAKLREVAERGRGNEGKG